MRDDGEPISRGNLDRRAAEIKALRDSLFLAVFFGVILINGILAILLIECFQAIGWWEVQPTGGAGEAAVLSRLMHRDAATAAGSVAAL